MTKAKTPDKRATRLPGKRTSAGATPAKPRTVKRTTSKTAATAVSNVKSHKSERYTPAQVVTALELTAGILTAAAEKLGCTRQTVASYVRRYPEIQEELDRILEARIDLAEGVVLQTMTRSKSEHCKLQAAMFYLKTKGKLRGYTERQELTGKDGGAIEHRNHDPIDLSGASEEDLEALEDVLARISQSAAGAKVINGHAPG